MIVLINYATKSYRGSQKINTKTAYRKGKVDRVISFGPKDLDKKFQKKNKKILKQKRGGGYWIWKPYIISKVLRVLSVNDVLIYCDSGAKFIESVIPLVKLFLSSKQDIMVFELQNCKEKRWTKRDAFILMDCEGKEYTETNQRMATIILCRKTSDSIRFFDEWLHFCQDANVSTDKKNLFDFDNSDDFRDHRHDQSIFSLLTKKYKLKVHRDPSQFGNSFRKKYKNSKYGQIIDLHRKQLPRE